MLAEIFEGQVLAITASAQPQARMLAALSGACAAIFLPAGAAKRRRPFAASVAIVRFGVLRRITPVSGRAVGITELAAGVVVLAQPLAVWAWVLPTCLSLAFVALVTRALRRGRPFDCGCFGSRRESAIGRGTLARNSAVLALCVSALALQRGAGAGSPSMAEHAQALASGCLALASADLAAVLLSTRPFRETDT